MEKQKEVYHLKDTINKAGRVFIVFSKWRLDSLDVFRHTEETPHNTCTTQLVSSIVFESSK